MRVLGLVFAGSATPHREAMTGFVRDVLGLAAVELDDVEADLFALPDGSRFAVAWPGGMGDTERSLGLLVDDLDTALAELTAAGVETGTVTANAAERYVHFRAPDGNLYELVERRPPVPR